MQEFPRHPRRFIDAVLPQNPRFPLNPWRLQPQSLRAFIEPVFHKHGDLGNQQAYAVQNISDWRFERKHLRKLNTQLVGAVQRKEGGKEQRD